MKSELELEQLVRVGLEHFRDHRDKAAAIQNAVSMLQNIGMVDWLTEQLSVAIDQYKIEEGSDDDDRLDRVLQKSLLERIGYEATELDIHVPLSRSGSECFEVPDPAN